MGTGLVSGTAAKTAAHAGLRMLPGLVVRRSARRLRLLDRRGRASWLVVLLGGGVAIGLGGCRPPSSGGLEQVIQRQEQMQLQVQQLEQRLNSLRPSTGTGGENGGKAPAGAVKSLTYRSGTNDDRLRIYWADGSTSDLPCTKEQNTLVCG